MMGRQGGNGDWCPFLDENAKSPHGGHTCSIYKERPLACRAYPVLDAASAGRKTRPRLTRTASSAGRTAPPLQQQGGLPASWRRLQ